MDVIAASSTADDRVAFENLLARRELDVLRLLARGEANSAVAAELVISESTVKFHVVNLLRKPRPWRDRLHQPCPRNASAPQQKQPGSGVGRPA
jgi:FixJ family two-component response regulator